MKRKDDGMTILEVVMAITIFMIGVVFILKGDAVSYRYRSQQELHQQVVFFAAGCMETVLGLPNESLFEGHVEPPNNIIVANYDYSSASSVNSPIFTPLKDDEIKPIPSGLQNILIPFKVIVSTPNLPDFEMYNYRLANEF